MLTAFKQCRSITQWLTYNVFILAVDNMIFFFFSSWFMFVHCKQPTIILLQLFGEAVLLFSLLQLIIVICDFSTKLKKKIYIYVNRFPLLFVHVHQVWFQNRRSKERRMKQLSALGARRHAFFRSPRRMRTLVDRLEPGELIPNGPFSYYGGKIQWLIIDLPISNICLKYVFLSRAGFICYASEVKMVELRNIGIF